MIYLDHAATSWPKPRGVTDAWVRYHEEVAGSPGRGSHRGSVEAARRVERVRAELCAFLGGSDPSRLLFTASCTDALNLALAGLLAPGDHVVATDLDHNAVLRPLAQLAAQGRISLSLAPADREGRVSADALRSALRAKTRLLVCTHASNALGTIQDTAPFVEIARACGALVLLDAAQTAGVLPIDARRDGFDLVAIPGHKGLLGPSGVGALLVGDGIALHPTRFGGTGLDSLERTPPVAWPASFEPGTGNPGGIVALGAGLRAVAEEGCGSIRAREERLAGALLEGIAKIPGARIFGNRDPVHRTGVLAFALDGFPPDEVAAILDASFEIRVRAGAMCAPGALRAVGAPEGGFVRASVGFTTTASEVDAFLEAIREIAASR